MTKLKRPEDFFRKPETENRIDSAEDKMRKLQDIYNNPRTPARDKMAAIELHMRLEEGLIHKAAESEKD